MRAFEMKRSAKALALLLALIMILSLALTGCGDGGNGEAVDPNAAGSEAGDGSGEGAEGSGEGEGAEGSGESAGEEEPAYVLSQWQPMRAGKPVDHMFYPALDFDYIDDEEAESHIAEVAVFEQVAGQHGTNSIDSGLGYDFAEGISCYGNYIQIDGLVDEEIEASINRQIYDMYLRMCAQTELPGYRGIKRIARTAELDNVFVYPLYSCVGNLLSVGVQKNWSLKGENSWNHISDYEYVVFDLKTGGVVTLESLFGDNVDYKKVLEREVQKQLPAVVDDVPLYYEHNGDYIYNDGGIKQVAPFEGVDEDQMFMLSLHGITLYFDENDPEFDTSFGSWSGVTIYYADIQDEAVYPVRLEAEQELYTNPMTAALVQSYNSDQEMVETKYEQPLDVQYTITWPEGLSEKDRQRLIGDDRKAMEKRMDDWYINNYDAIQNGEWSYLNYSVNITEVGPYYSVSHELYGNCSKNTSYISHSIQKTFFKQTFNEVQLDELFVKGVDVKGLLYDDMIAAMEDHRSYNEGAVVYTPEQAWEGRAVSVNLHAIVCYFPINDSGGYVSTYHGFEGIGYENLAVFQ